MKVSTRTRYGIRAAIELAQHYQKGPLQLRIIAERQAISVKYLEQLVAVLRSGGLVRSMRGARGGYLLAKSPDQIKLSAVFHCLEGPVAATEETETENVGEQSLDRVARKLWKRVETAVNDVLDSVTLQDMLNEANNISQNYQI